MTIHAVRQFAFTVFILAGAGLLTAGVSAHLTVTRTMPADESTVSAPPERVQVWFSQAASPRLSRLELRGPGGDVALGEIEVDSKERSISAALAAPLMPGRYEAAWRTAGDDGHVMRGTFTFTLTPAE